MSNGDGVQRRVLPIPDKAHTGLVSYHAKDPDTTFPPVVPLRPPAAGWPCTAGKGGNVPV